MKSLKRQGPATFVLLLAISTWSLSASAQVLTSFSALPNQGQVGNATDFHYSILATDHPNQIIPTGSGAIIRSFDLAVDYGDGNSDSFHGGNSVSSVNFFSHFYNAPGTYISTASVTG